MKKWMIRALSALLIAAFLPLSVLADEYDLNEGSVTVSTTKQPDGSTKQEVTHKENTKTDSNPTITSNGNETKNTITIKATALPYSAQIRQTEKSKAWEAYTLSGIANEMAAANGMTCMFLANSDPSYGRVEQYKQSDIAFLSKLCHEAGISLKATNNLIVLFDQEDYEKKSPVLTIVRGSGSYTKHKLNAGTAGTQYASCRVSYTDPGTGKCIEATVKVEDYNDKAKNNQQLEITAKVASVAEAKTKAEKYLRLHNKYAKTATFTLPGNPDIVAGVTAKLTGWGAWDGKYIVEQAAHSVGSSGYTTQVKLRKTLEGY